MAIMKLPNTIFYQIYQLMSLGKISHESLPFVTDPPTFALALTKFGDTVIKVG